ncbi:MAG: type II secretion system protein [Tepidisphaeraceae bacterium]
MQLATSYPAFTLIELMLSLAMVLILILGINFVFRTATDAVGAGNALNSINSDSQATQPMIFDDLRNVSKNPPCFIISSQLVTQFLNSDDAKTSSDPTVIVTDNAGTQVKIANGPPAGYVSSLSAAILGPRNHRADMLKFFAHALYHRRSGPDGTYYASDSSNDALIEYGHAALPSNDLSQFYGPSSLPNNATTYSNYMYAGNTVTGVPRIGAYASDWVLTRRVTLLKDPSTITSPGDYFYKVDPTTPNSIDNVTPTPFGANVSPLSYGTPDNNPSASLQTQLQSSRYDLAGITPEQLDRRISDAILTYQSVNSTGGSLWWNPLVYSLPLNQPAAHPSAINYASLPTPPYVKTYLTGAPNYICTLPGFSSRPGLVAAISAAGAPYANPGLWYNRPQCNPTIQSPVTAASLAEMAPYFLQHCSQFIVEYAGDYLTQDNAPTDARFGDITNLGPDGQIDYYVDANNNKHIRWYGMPRSSTGVPHSDGKGNMVLIRGFDPLGGSGETLNDPTKATSPPSATVMANYFTDVIPLRDYYSLYYSTYPPTGAPTPAYCCPPWEVDVNFDCAHDYGSLNLVPGPNSNTGNNNAFSNPGNPPRYVAAWHDDMPAMIRILIKVDDPNNKVKDGPWYEYVFRLK